MNFPYVHFNASKLFGLIAILIFLVLFGLYFQGMIKKLHSFDGEGLTERFSNINAVKAPWLLEQRGGYWGRYGWYLHPGEEGLLRIRLPSDEDAKLSIRLMLVNAGYLKSSIVTVGSEKEFSGEDGEVHSFDISKNTELLIQATNQLNSNQLIVDRMDVTSQRTMLPLPSMIPLFFGAFMLIAWALRMFYRNPKYRYRVLGVGFILLAALVGLSVRVEWLNLFSLMPLPPDGQGYLKYAEGFRWFSSEHGFYSGSFNEREPLYIAVLHLWSIVGEGAPFVRLFSVMTSVLLIIATGAFIWRLSGVWFLGVVGAWIMSLNGILIDESVRGLRVEFYTLLFLAVLATWLWGRGWRWAIILGVTIGLLTLLRSPGLSIILPLLWGTWLFNLLRQYFGKSLLSPSHWNFKHLMLVSMIGISLFVPHLYGLYKVHGDPSWPSYGYARWNANCEFPERLGTLGFPSKAEFALSPYAGPRITYAQYMFDLHTIKQLITGQILGWGESLAYMSASISLNIKDPLWRFLSSGKEGLWSNKYIITFLAMIVSLVLTGVGFVSMLRDVRLWWVPWMCLWGTWYAAYLYSVRLVEPFRHTGHVYPLLLFCMIWGGWIIFRKLKTIKSPELLS